VTALDFDVAQTTTEARDLPAHLTRFIGREREIADLLPLLASTRLLTLTGSGGSGKTRLASELAARAAARFDTMAWVDFAALSDASLVATQVVEALNLPERAGTSSFDTLLSEISGREFLLVLDNCEHLVDACAALAETLLRHCPRLTILATSRQALGISGETSWLVPPMQSDEATQLFAERAQSVQASFRLTEANAGVLAAICRRLDGLPLAIELAAARVRVLSPEQIAERLHDAFRLLTGGRSRRARRRWPR
jgi:predicted ATPase